MLVSLCSVSSNFGAIFELNRNSMPRPRTLGQVDSHDRERVIARAAFERHQRDDR